MKTVQKFFVLFVSLCIISCSKKSSHPPVLCTVHPKDASCTENTAVVYYVSINGTGHITSVTYSTAGGPVTVNNLASDWLVKITIPANTSISITATGEVTSGKIIAGFGFVDNGNTIDITDECG